MDEGSGGDDRPAMEGPAAEGDDAADTGDDEQRTSGAGMAPTGPFLDGYVPI